MKTYIDINLYVSVGSEVSEKHYILPSEKKGHFDISVGPSSVHFEGRFNQSIHAHSGLASLTCRRAVNPDPGVASSAAVGHCTFSME